MKPATTDHFPPSKQTKDGLFRWCRDCKRGSDRKSHAKHAPERQAKMRARYHANPEPQRARARAAAAANPEANRARALAWNRANKDRHSAHVRTSDQRLAVRDPERRRERWRRRNALLRKAVEVHQFPIALLAGKLAYYGGVCRWCRVREAECWDHVKPLAAGGPHMLANLVPACTTCNATKRDVWPLVVVLALARRLREVALAGSSALG